MAAEDVQPRTRLQLLRDSTPFFVHVRTRGGVRLGMVPVDGVGFVPKRDQFCFVFHVHETDPDTETDSINVYRGVTALKSADFHLLSSIDQEKCTWFSYRRDHFDLLATTSRVPFSALPLKIDCETTEFFYKKLLWICPCSRRIFLRTKIRHSEFGAGQLSPLDGAVPPPADPRVLALPWHDPTGCVSSSTQAITRADGVSARVSCTDGATAPLLSLSGVSGDGNPAADPAARATGSGPQHVPPVVILSGQEMFGCGDDVPAAAPASTGTDADPPVFVSSAEEKFGDGNPVADPAARATSSGTHSVHPVVILTGEEMFGCGDADPAAASTSTGTYADPPVFMWSPQEMFGFPDGVESGDTSAKLRKVARTSTESTATEGPQGKRRRITPTKVTTESAASEERMTTDKSKELSAEFRIALEEEPLDAEDINADSDDEIDAENSMYDNDPLFLDSTDWKPSRREVEKLTRQPFFDPGGQAGRRLVDVVFRLETILRNAFQVGGGV